MATAATHVDLWMPFNDVYQLVLSIPVAMCQQFSIHPLLWLRYVGYTIYGNEGHISTLQDGPKIDYYQVPILPGTYYYVSQDPCLIDPDGMDDRTSDASSTSESTSILQSNFRDRVMARDQTCVMTGAQSAQGLEACHIIPHAKGHQYMNNLVNYRNEQYFEPLNRPLNDINDTRNGILLSKMLHPFFGASNFAFLRTPNFAMTVNDVDLVRQPTADLLGFNVEPSVANSRLTLQHFETLDAFTRYVVPHNSDARQSDGDDWPPPLIFDVAYGCAALRAWGEDAFVQFCRMRAKGIYDGLRDDNGGGGGGDMGDSGDAGDGGSEQNRSDEQPDVTPFKRSPYKLCSHDMAKQKGKGKTREDDDITYADMIMALWTLNAKKNPYQAAKEVETQENVQTWLESIESP